MNFTFRGKRISGLLAVLPANERTFLEDMKNFDFPEKKSIKLKTVMGYDRHRVVEPGVCASDLATAGLTRLIEQGRLARDGFEALIFVSQSPDHVMPPTSNLIQGRLGLKKDMLCLDLNQGCAGFLIGLIEAFLLLELDAVRRVVLVNADALSPRVSVRDKNSYPLIGDAAAITVVDRDPSAPVIHANLKMDGAAAKALIIPAGGFRTRSTPETAIQVDVGDNNYRALDDLSMDGTAVFNFVQQEVPPMIEDLLSFAGSSREAIDYYLFHQPNKFMLQKLAERLGAPQDRMPNNIVEHFGNASGVTVPTNIAFNLGAKLLDTTFQVCLAGFGAGLTWSSMLMRLGKLDFCEMMDV